MDNSELIPTTHVLYDNLFTYNPVNLLDFTRPAFSFISNDGFGQCNSWPQELLTEVQAFIQLHQNRVVPILQVILTRIIADGFAKQRGHIFGFGNGNEEEAHQLDSADPSLDMALQCSVLFAPFNLGVRLI